MRRASLAALFVLSSVAAPVFAEVRVLEVVGAAPLDAATRASGNPKELAIAGALWEGVSRVAEDLLLDSTRDDEEAGADPVRAALGGDMAPYTRSFRIVDDQGERPMLFTEHPDAATEYVVVVEVQVEVERVRERLAAAGLLTDEGRGSLQTIRVEVRDLSRYDGYARLVALLRSEAVGAETVRPIELERGRSILAVQAEWGPEELLSRLLAEAPAELRITPIRVGAAAASGAPGGGGAPGESGTLGESGAPDERADLVISIRYEPLDADMPEPLGGDAGPAARSVADRGAAIDTPGLDR